LAAKREAGDMCDEAFPNVSVPRSVGVAAGVCE
jgi:hypothetical protein